jgi:hypothetical protein
MSLSACFTRVCTFEHVFCQNVHILLDIEYVGYPSMDPSIVLLLYKFEHHTASSEMLANRVHMFKSVLKYILDDSD